MALRLEVHGLAAERGGRRLFADLSFRLEGGELLAVAGPNGAGKSTLLRILAGLLPPAEGRVALDPPEAAGDDVPIRERVHYVGHGDGLKAALTAAENLAFAAALLDRRTADPAAALARMGLAHLADLPCGYLSAGQRRRVALARLLVARRPLWILDEPTTALDAEAQSGVAGVLREHLGTGGLVVAATHGPLGLDADRSVRLGSS